MANPLIDDRLTHLLLNELLDIEGLSKLPAFADHSRETFELYIDSCRKFARDELFETFRPMDEEPPRFENGRVFLHPKMKHVHQRMVDLGIVTATRPEEVGGHQLPLCVATLAHVYLIAANTCAPALASLTTGAAHLVEAFGNERVRELFMVPMYEGRWTGTMALTEPHAGSSLADLTTRAVPAADGTYRIFGAKIFISGGDHDATENIVHLTLARIEGAPAGTAGVSLFAVPQKRWDGETLVPNDVAVSGMIHKIGWKGLPSVSLAYGDNGDCHGWLVGEPNHGLRNMFQMMNGARIGVGASGAACASAAYHESRLYALDRHQGRPLGVRDATVSPVPIVEHPDVRRMLLRQKSIVDASMCLVAMTSYYSDIADYGSGDAQAEASAMLDLLTPVTKTFPSQWGFEANVLAVQIHGGYGYSSEYLPEAWMRDQKLNTIHEGTTTIQSLDLLGRKVVAKSGQALRVFVGVVRGDIQAAAAADVEPAWCESLTETLGAVAGLTAKLGAFGIQGDLTRMLGHSGDYLDLFSITVAAWQHLRLATAARRRLQADADDGFAKGLIQGARYWFATELPRVPNLVALCEQAESSFLEMEPGWF